MGSGCCEATRPFLFTPPVFLTRNVLPIYLQHLSPFVYSFVSQSVTGGKSFLHLPPICHLIVIII